ncbi:MAG: N-acetyltransferase [Treponema sp.]|jgi:predicted N-acetyltransferase YhbS|nr:N-acetyltransferase [Treponema sp.]
MEIELRREEKTDYRIVEALTREAFWNIYRPGCIEHWILHTIREAGEFIRELDYVAVYNNEIIGNIVYSKTKILKNEEPYTVITFGPVSVLPKYQKMGVGKKLIAYTIEKSKTLGYNGIVIYGNSEYYKKYGFKNSREYNITDLEGGYNDALLVLELYPKALENINGRYYEGKIFTINKKELEEYEKGFAPKEKLLLNTHLFKE